MEPLRDTRNRLLNGWQLSKLYTFEVAARHQSFALAADELSLSPSAVSHRINQLEAELGIQLFVRSHRKVELTHEGKRVFWALKSSLDTLNQEILDIKNQELSGTLTVYSRCDGTTNSRKQTLSEEKCKEVKVTEIFINYTDSYN